MCGGGTIGFMDRQTGRSDLIALIPAYNESRHISSVIHKTQNYLPVLVVDDGSKDDTAALAQVAGAQVLRQVPNQGKGAALKAGFRAVLEAGHTGLVMLDADGQHDPDEIPKFLEAFARSGADLIIGKRSFDHMPFSRRLANQVGTLAFSWAIGRPIPDNQSGYRLLTRRMLEAMLASKESSFEFEVDMIVECVRRAYRLDWVPIQTIYGDQKSHIRPIPHIIHFFRMVWHTRQVRQKTFS